MNEPIWLGRNLIEAIHLEQIREHGGKLGLREVGLLDSALARAQNAWNYSDKADLAEIASEYGFGIARNHPFFDGNKRIAFSATNIFLLLNGFEIEAPEEDVAAVIVRLAEGRMTRPKYAEWIREHLVKGTL
jgi:death-on-curing protein